jgi:VanZ family protein
LQKNLLKKIYFPLIAAVSWFIISTILFTLPGTAFPKENWLDKIGFDKWVHIGIFAIMVTLWCLSRHRLQPGKDPQKLKNYFILIAILCVAYGVAIEFIQKYFIPFRSFDISDMVADAIGCVTGVIFSIKRHIKK